MVARRPSWQSAVIGIDTRGTTCPGEIPPLNLFLSPLWICRGVVSFKRYEIRRQLAPYTGVNWLRRIGTTAGYARQDHQPVPDRQIAAGVRICF